MSAWTRNKKALFVTGTGTDVGKSVVAAGLALAMAQLGRPVLAVKVVQTGVDAARTEMDGDAALYNDALKTCPVPTPDSRTLFSFPLPASPHLAARKAGQRLSVADVLSAVVDMLEKTEIPLLLEGAGGTMVPLNESESTLDCMEALGLPVLVVMRNELGALNHALLTLEALHHRGLCVLGVVAVQCALADPAQAVLLRDNVEFLRAHAYSVQVWEIPFVAELNCAEEEKRRAGWLQAAAALMPVAKAWYEDMPTNDVSAKDLAQWDREHLWHPYTSTVDPLPVLEAVRAQGTRIFLRDGRSLVDGMASWWCAVHGYSHPDLVRAARVQAGRMAHVMFGGLTHAPAVRLGQKLLPLLPQGLEHIFWADSGSVAVEVALKMALQYAHGCGEHQRTRILAPLGGYHGDTLGAMSVCDPINGMHGLFGNVVPQHIFVPRPSCPFDAPFDSASTHALEEAFERHGHELAVVIVEPVVQGAGGMWFYHPEYLCCLRKLCDNHGVLLIFDEIATGFGRTGKLFAAEWAHVSPDILCLGKALTGGFMTLAATVCTAETARGICAHGQVFMHGPTFMGNALACAVAEASLDILLRTPWQERVLALQNALLQGLGPCRHLPGVIQVRVLGAIGVVEMRDPVPVANLQRFFVQRGVWIRPFGRLIYLMPPFTATAEDVEQLTSTVVEALRRGVDNL